VSASGGPPPAVPTAGTGSSGSGLGHSRSLRSAPLFGVAVALFAAAVASTALRLRLGSAGLSVAFPLEVGGGIAAAGAVVLLLFGGEAAPAPPADSRRTSSPTSGTGGWPPPEEPLAEHGDLAAATPGEPAGAAAAVRAASGDPSLGSLPLAALPVGRPLLARPSAEVLGPPATRTGRGGGPSDPFAPAAVDLGELRAADPRNPAAPAAQDTSRSAARAVPVDPVNMNLGEFMRVLYGQIGSSRPSRGPGASTGPASGATVGSASPSPAVPLDPAHPRCVSCAAAIPAFPSPGRCPSCGRPMCSDCQVASVNSGALGRCRDCRAVTPVAPTP
jgi:hypothetical protein